MFSLPQRRFSHSHFPELRRTQVCGITNRTCPITFHLLYAGRYHPLFVVVARAQSLLHSYRDARTGNQMMQVGTKGALRANDIPSPSLKPLPVECPGVLVRGCCDGRRHWRALVIQSDGTSPKHLLTFREECQYIQCSC